MALAIVGILPITMPIDYGSYFAFLLAASALVLSPGPDTVLIIRNTLSSGKTVGLATVAGIQMGLVVHTLLAVAGVSLLIVSSAWLFRMVAILGACYLGYLGVQHFLHPSLIHVEPRSRQSRLLHYKAFRDALITNLLNPKVILLFLALLPGFVQPERGHTSLQLILLALGLLVINLVWQTPIALAANTFRQIITQPQIQRWISHTTGGILLVFAGLILWEHVFHQA